MCFREDTNGHRSTSSWDRNPALYHMGAHDALGAAAIIPMFRVSYRVKGSRVSRVRDTVSLQMAQRGFSAGEKRT